MFAGRTRNEPALSGADRSRATSTTRDTLCHSPSFSTTSTGILFSDKAKPFGECARCALQGTIQKIRINSHRGNLMKFDASTTSVIVPLGLSAPLKRVPRVPYESSPTHLTLVSVPEGIR